MDTPHVIFWNVSLEQVGTRLDRGLASLSEVSSKNFEAWELLQGMSRSRLKKLIESGGVLVDGQAVPCSYKLQLGQEIRITLPVPEPLELTAEPMPLDILFEDEDVVVVNKPAGLVVHPGAGHSRGTLVHGLLAHCGDLTGIGDRLRPGVVHRLDRYTSGVMVVAKNQAAHESLSRQFSERSIKKHYVAFVIGKPNPHRGIIDTRYGRHPVDRKRFSSKVASGKRALTSFAVEASAGGVSRVGIVLGTGRTHQIRVHFSDLGHPVVGDVVYGGDILRNISDKGILEVAQGLGRHALHASRLEFMHPQRQELVTIEAALSAELALLNAKLEAALKS